MSLRALTTLGSPSLSLRAAATIGLPVACHPWAKSTLYPRILLYLAVTSTLSTVKAPPRCG
ncbi:hypothetical protein D1872_286390 [compost metagenome]